MGAHACVVGGGFGAVRIPFVMVQQSPPLPLDPTLSLFLHAEVYVKALRKTITLTCASPPDQS